MNNVHWQGLDGYRSRKFEASLLKIAFLWGITPKRVCYWCGAQIVAFVSLNVQKQILNEGRTAWLAESPPGTVSTVI